MANGGGRYGSAAKKKHPLFEHPSLTASFLEERRKGKRDLKTRALCDGRKGPCAQPFVLQAFYSASRGKQFTEPQAGRMPITVPEFSLGEAYKDKPEQQQQKPHPCESNKDSRKGEKNQKRNQIETLENDFSKRVLRWAK